MNIKKTVSLILIMVITALSCGIFTTSATSASQVQSQINELEKKSQQLEKQIRDLKNKKASQQEIVAAIQAKISNTESRIIACNNEISRINSVINANKVQINKKNQEIAADELTFKKRLRASYMSNTENSVRILLGADNFSDYLQLSQLMKSVSEHDKALIEKLNAAIKVLEQKNAENEKLLNQQVTVKQSVVAIQNSLAAERAEEQKLLGSISSQTNAVTAENKEVEAQIRERNQYLLNLTASSNIVLSDKYFIWPVPGKYGVSQNYGVGGHTGVDLSSGGIAGAPIVAIASGTVKVAFGGWSSSMGKYGMASYGNYVVVDHGSRGGNSYISLSAHMSRVAVSVGQSVKQGQVIGYVGTTGNSSGYHLHLELRKNNGRVNPLPYIRQQIAP